MDLATAYFTCPVCHHVTEPPQLDVPTCVVSDCTHYGKPKVSTTKAGAQVADEEHRELYAPDPEGEA